MPSESVDMQTAEKVAPTETTTVPADDWQELRPYVHRHSLGEADLKKPVLVTALMYFVRQGHEDDDTRMLELAAQRAKVRPGAASVKDGVRVSTYTDAEQIATLYDGLPQHEKERVWNFAHDAEARGANLDRQRDFAILEAFTSFLWEDLEAEPAQVMEWLSLTQEQYDLYKTAWQMLNDVYNQKWRLASEEGEGA